MERHGGTPAATPPVRDLYFAYGSNLSASRMCERVSSAVLRGPAQLNDHRLTTDKISIDGSGKANLRAESNAVVWGVLYEIDRADWRVLDNVEVRYSRVRVQVLTADGRSLDAQTYVSSATDPALVTFDWYKQLMVEGARDHGLPAGWIATLEALPEAPDPRRLSPD